MKYIYTEMFAVGTINSTIKDWNYFISVLIKIRNGVVTGIKSLFCQEQHLLFGFLLKFRVIYTSAARAATIKAAEKIDCPVQAVVYNPLIKTPGTY